MESVAERSERIWHDAAKRYADREPQRIERERNMRHGGDWRKVEEPSRVQTRLRLKGYRAGSIDRLMNDAFADSAAGTVLLERIMDESELLEVGFLFYGARIARSVGRVVIRSSSGQVFGYGTGSMVSGCHNWSRPWTRPTPSSGRSPWHGVRSRSTVRWPIRTLRWGWSWRFVRTAWVRSQSWVKRSP